MLFIVDETKETALDFSKETAKVLFFLFRFNIILI